MADPEIEDLAFNSSMTADVIKQLQAKGWQLYTGKAGLFRAKDANFQMKSWTTIYIEAREKKIEPREYIKQLIAAGWRRLKNEEGLWLLIKQ